MSQGSRQTAQKVRSWSQGSLLGAGILFVLACSGVAEEGARREPARRDLTISKQNVYPARPVEVSYPIPWDTYIVLHRVRCVSRVGPNETKEERCSSHQISIYSNGDVLFEGSGTARDGMAAGRVVSMEDLSSLVSHIDERRWLSFPHDRVVDCWESCQDELRIELQLRGRYNILYLRTDKPRHRVAKDVVELADRIERLARARKWIGSPPRFESPPAPVKP